MKNLYTAGFVVILLFTAQSLSAQKAPPLKQRLEDKPQLFASLPDKFEFEAQDLLAVFNSSSSQKVNFKLNSGRYDGMIRERVQKSKDVSSVNLTLAEYPNALFSLSKINNNGSISFVGRIVSRDNGDVLMLKKENDKYFFIKQQQKFTMVE